jgi:hypothetical protein
MRACEAASCECGRPARRRGGLHGWIDVIMTSKVTHPLETESIGVRKVALLAVTTVTGKVMKVFTEPLKPITVNPCQIVSRMNL